MVKKIFIFIAILFIVIIAAVFIYRYQIFQYSAETIIRKALPDYVRIDRMRFDLQNSRVILNGFKILNPQGFSHKDLLEIDEITCKFRMKGKAFLDGIEILDPVFKNAVLTIERLNNGKLNLVEMQGELEKSKGPQTGNQALENTGAAVSAMMGPRKVSDIIKLPKEFLLKGGKIIFVDKFGMPEPHIITFENIDAGLFLNLNDSYSSVVSLSSTGQGNVSGDREEVVKWVISYNPNTPKLTMSNRFEVSNIDIMPFEPYYEKYSPIIFTSGRFSGSLIFDFDNGNIGSTDEIHLSNFKFYIKQGYENAMFWETTVPDIVKYFSSSFGEIVFDFKIKGDMSNPKFYLGPISKQALTSMAIDKVSDVIQKASNSSAGGAKSDMGKAKQYIDLFQGIINKK